MQAGYDVAENARRVVVVAVALAVSAVADLAAPFDRVRPWMLPGAALLGLVALYLEIVKSTRVSQMADHIMRSRDSSSR